MIHYPFLSRRIGVSGQLNELKKIVLVVLVLAVLVYLLFRFVSPATVISTCEFQGGVCQKISLDSTKESQSLVCQPDADKVPLKNFGTELCKKQNTELQKGLSKDQKPTEQYICCKKMNLDSLTG
jgi:hypothetical protein